MNEQAHISRRGQEDDHNRVVPEITSSIAITDGEYDARDLHAPILTGIALKAFLLLTETPFSRTVFQALLKRNRFIHILEKSGQWSDFQPLFLPDTSNWPVPSSIRRSCITLSEEENAISDTAKITARIDATMKALNITKNNSNTLRYHDAYLSGTTTPLDIAHRIINIINQDVNTTKSMNFFIQFTPEIILQQAQASALRYESKQPLSPIDGVPFAVKDDFDVNTLFDFTSSGTSFIHLYRKVQGTLPGIAALLSAGAILIGKTNMHEIGLGITGLNTVHGTPRNPYDLSRHTGGSSSGSASVVASGLCVFAVGGDGGGSIRIPSSFCGCVGLKPTHDRVYPYPRPKNASSVGVAGPIAASVRDCAVLYAALANIGHKEGFSGENAENMVLPVPPSITFFEERGMEAGMVEREDEEEKEERREIGKEPGMVPLFQGVKIGVYETWFEHADTHVVAACKAALQLLVDHGALLVDIKIPYLNELSLAHSATITTEMRSGMVRYYSQWKLRKQMNAETRISLAAAEAMSATSYVTAQKIRRKMDIAVRDIFKFECDVIATPTVPIVAPKIINNAALKSGASDMGMTVRLMRFLQLANMLGLPAITVPVGYYNSSRVSDAVTTTSGCTTASSVNTAAAAAGGGGGGSGGGVRKTMQGRNLPIGLQLMAAPWQESLLFAAAIALEDSLKSFNQEHKQQFYCDPLAAEPVE